MHLLELPAEVLFIIIQYLDTKSKINTYNSCSNLRNVFSPSHMRKVKLSQSTLGTVTTLNQDIFIDLGQHIHDLNLSGIPDLTKETTKKYISKMKELKSLDITFTELYLSDLVEICPASLTNISINFFICPSKAFHSNCWGKCKELFREHCFTSVHFVVFEYEDSHTPLLFLKDTAKLKDLKVTVAENYRKFWNKDDDDAESMHGEVSTCFQKLTYVFRDCGTTHKYSTSLKGLFDLDFHQIEYVFLMYLEHIVIYASPLLRTMFCSNIYNVNIEACQELPTDFMLDGNIIFKAWDKQTTEFDEKFFKNLSLELKDYFPTYICMRNKLEMKISKAVSDWYCIDSSKGFENYHKGLLHKVTLCDFCRHDGHMHKRRPFNLSRNAAALQKLTYLRLTNILLKDDFFSNLFTVSPDLTTLDIYIERRGVHGNCQGYVSSLCESIHHARSLTNFKLTSDDIDYDLLFYMFSRCPSLENVQVCEYEREFQDNYVNFCNINSMIKNCVNLYSLFIEADMSPENLTLLMSPLRAAAQSFKRDHLLIEVCPLYEHGGWNPFADVINPSPLHILQ